MKKERIEITKSNDYIHFYLVYGEHREWLFSQPYSLSVELYFKGGRSVAEIRRSTGKWRHNPRLAKTVERLPSAIAYIRKDNELPYRDGHRRYYHTTYRDLYTV